MYKIKDIISSQITSFPNTVELIKFILSKQEFANEDTIDLRSYYYQEFNNKYKIYEYSDRVFIKVESEFNKDPKTVEIVFGKPKAYDQTFEVWELPCDKVLELTIVKVNYLPYGVNAKHGKKRYGPAPLCNCQEFVINNKSSYTYEDYISDHEEAVSQSKYSDFYEATDGQLGDLGEDGWMYLGRD